MPRWCGLAPAGTWSTSTAWAEFPGQQSKGQPLPPNTSVGPVALKGRNSRMVERHQGWTLIPVATQKHVQFHSQADESREADFQVRSQLRRLFISPQSTGRLHNNQPTNSFLNYLNFWLFSQASWTCPLSCSSPEERYRENPTPFL